MNIHNPALAQPRSGYWLPIFAGFCASLVSVGLARFAYTPLIPALIHAQWFSAGDVVYLSAANLIGYLIGALSGRPLGQRLGNRMALRLMMVAVTLSFFACAFPLSLAWFFGWRLLSGIAGGIIIVLVAATVLPHVPAARKGLASGAIFVGVGIGVAASGTLIPPLLTLGLQDTWLGLGVLALLLSAASWFGWPTDPHRHVAAAGISHASPATGTDPAVYLLYVQYGLMAAGLVPVMVFLVDYVARGLGAGAHVGAVVWIMYGVGAIIGPVTYGLLADKLGARTGIRLVLAVQAVALGLLTFWHAAPALMLLAIVFGSFPPGIVPLALARIHELVPDHHRQQIGWSRATVSFATCQAITGYAYSAVFNATGGKHAVLFGIASAALVLALLLEPAMRLLRSDRQAETVSE